MDQQENAKPYSIAMLLLPAFNSMAAHAFIDPFRVANYLMDGSYYEWQFLSLDGEEVVASNGLSIANAQSFDELETLPDVLVINSSWSPERFQDSKLKNWLRIIARQGVTLVGLDTGVFVLAYADLMEHYQATMHFEHRASFRELFPNTIIHEGLFCFDRDRWSCCGGLAAADFALDIIRMRQDIELSSLGAKYIFQDRLRMGEETQSHVIANYQKDRTVGVAMPDKLSKAISVMENAVEETLTIASIAGDVGMSQRQLERTFKQYTGVTPVRYYINLRLERARHLLTQTDLPIVEIASACGFQSHENFTRAYKKRFQILPKVHRFEGRIPFEFRTSG